MKCHGALPWVPSCSLFFVDVLDEGTAEMLIRFLDDSKLKEVARGEKKFSKNLDRLPKNVALNRMEFNREEFKVMQLGEKKKVTRTEWGRLNLAITICKGSCLP